MLRLTNLGVFLFTFFGIASSDTIYVPGDQPTIQAGIDAAVTGDTVLVAPGTYFENVNYKGKEIAIISSDGPEQTTIDGSQPVDPERASVVAFINGEGSGATLEGFSIVNGQGSFIELPFGSYEYCGGGVLCIGSSPHITNNIIKSNTVTFAGAGICCFDNAHPEICQNEIVENVTERSGGGIFCYQNSSPVINDNKIISNIANWGGGIDCLDYSSPHISMNTIRANSATSDGAGIQCSSTCDPLITGNVIKENASVSCGGGIDCSVGASPKIIDNRIVSNTGSHGAGIYCSYESSPEIFGNTIAMNSATDMGGGIRCMKKCNPDIRQNTITGNTALCGGGFGIAQYSMPSIIENCIAENSATEGGGLFFDYCQLKCPVYLNTIVSNTADRGGAIYCKEYGLDLVNNMIIDNSAMEQGGALYAESSNINIINCTVSGNSAGIMGGGVYCLGGGFYQFGSLKIQNSIFWLNSAPAVHELAVIKSGYFPFTVFVHSSDIEGGQLASYIDPDCITVWGADVISKDPRFVSSLDCHLTYNSPCRDSGTLKVAGSKTMTEYDIDGNPRQAYGMIDMGADEFYRHFYCTGKFKPNGWIQAKITDLPGTNPLYILLAYDVLQNPYTLKWGDFYLSAPWVILGPLGSVHQDGILILSDYIPQFPSGPYNVYLQALIGLDEESLSQLFVLNVE